MREKPVLFVCKGNSGRSQIAEAFFNHISKTRRATSAGTLPDRKIDPRTVQIMDEVGIDVRYQKPKPLTEDLMKNAHRIIVMDASAMNKIPTAYLQKTENWKVEGLLGKSMDHSRKIRGYIKKRIYEMNMK